MLTDGWLSQRTEVGLEFREKQDAGAASAAAGFPVVALGASAGGLDAFREFFRALPARTGMAFVVVQHLSPDHESRLADLLRKTTEIPIVEMKDDVEVRPDTAYVIMPDQALLFEGGMLRLRPAGDRPRHPIDTLFESMAQELRERAIAVVLSGAGSNGAFGVTRIKEEGGAVFVQAPETAAHDSMPRMTIATGVVDRMLAPGDMPEALIAYAAQPYARGGGAPGLAEDERPHLGAILSLLAQRNGHDFRGYKTSTVTRRIRRRMGLAQVERMADYAERVAEDPKEREALSRDLLINVTAFFRDVEAWDALRDLVVRPLVEKHDGDGAIRAWVTACSTGEEAYSIGMLFAEEAERARKPVPIKIFATDAAPHVLQRARLGVFPASVAESMPQERLSRFFDKHGATYKAKKSLRESIVFAPQDLLSDPPFSRLDLVTCRNLLIYLDQKTQHRVLGLLHFALREDGFLFLGPAETAGGFGEMFREVSKKWRVYRRVGLTRHALVDFPGSEHGLSLPTRAALGAFEDAPADRGNPADEARAGLAERFAPPSVLIDKAFRVHHFHGPTEAFLRQPSGEPTRDLLRLARPGLGMALRAAVGRAARDGRPLSVDAVLGDPQGGEAQEVRLTVSPLRGGSDPTRFLVSFQRGGEAPSKEADDSVVEAPALLGEDGLEDALRSSRAELGEAIARLESSNEDLTASNEEVVSMNEELQSTNEELETSKEEMQSLNEELNTVNNQLQAKVQELEDRTNDLDNLLRSTDVATLFLDRELRIRWFTPAVGDLIDAMRSDVGRPLAHLALKFEDDAFRSDAEAVLGTLQAREAEVQSHAGRWYLRRTLPYRTEDDRIEGVVVTFMDVTDRHEADAELRRSEERFRALITTSAQTVWTTDAEGLITEDSASWRDYTGQSAEAWLGKGWADVVHPDDRERALRAWEEAVRSDGLFVQNFRLHHAPSGEWRMTEARAVPLHAEDGSVRGWVGINRDVSERHRAERRQQALLDELQHRVKNLFANITSLLALSAKSAEDEAVERFVTGFRGRLSALERTQDVLSSASDGGVMLRELVLAELAAHGAGEHARVTVDGPELMVSRRNGQAIGMAVHELATNACKYGALRPEHEDARLTVSWTTIRDGVTRFILRWREEGVRVEPPGGGGGFGSELLREIVPFMLRGKTSHAFEEDGVLCTLEATLEDVVPSKSPVEEVA
jgi:two-component system CheB/CheR fusion protein